MKTPVQGTSMGLRFGEVVAPAAPYGDWLCQLAAEPGDFPLCLGPLCLPNKYGKPCPIRQCGL